MDARGILIAVDEKQEWLLPWWWSNYTQENSLPVAIVDLGMSAQARAWCKERASVLDFDSDASYIKRREEFPEEKRQDWEEIYGETVWQARQAWFKKPFAMLKTPFKTTLWLDLDCEVLGPLLPLFEMLPESEEMGIVREPLIRQGNPALLLGEVLYNSGVVLYRQNSSLLTRWAEESQSSNELFWNDQLALSRLIFTEKFSVHELPAIYNHHLSSGIFPNAVIIHWLGSWGKAYIRKHGGLRETLRTYL